VEARGGKNNPHHQRTCQQVDTQKVETTSACVIVAVEIVGRAIE